MVDKYKIPHTKIKNTIGKKYLKILKKLYAL
jgi:hypothetical protein